MNQTAWKVHKFGGTSVADAACMTRVGDILETDPSPRLAVVLSACHGVTDALLGLVSAAEDRKGSIHPQLDALRDRHVAIAKALLDADGATAFIASLDADYATSPRFCRR